jgi:hypothetical protein
LSWRPDRRAWVVVADGQRLIDPTTWWAAEEARRHLEDETGARLAIERVEVTPWP